MKKSTIIENTKLVKELNMSKEADASKEESMNLEKKIEEEFENTDWNKDLPTDFNGFERYMKQMNCIQLLTPDQEKELAFRIAKGGKDGKKALDELVKANLRLVCHCAKKFIGQGAEYEDLVSMGNFGLIRAAQKFDPSLGFRFSTYAVWWIRHAIVRRLSDEGNLIRIPVHMSETVRKMGAIEKDIILQTGKKPSAEVLAKKAGAKETQSAVAAYSRTSVISLDTPVGEKGEATLESFLADEKSITPIDSALFNDRKDIIANIISQLPEKEARVLTLRYGLNGEEPMTLAQVASQPEFQVTRERIRQIETRAINRIRHNYVWKNQLKEYVG